MQHIKYAENTSTQKTQKTKETQIYVVHLVWATSTPNNYSFLSIIQQNEKTKPTADPLEYPLFFLTISLSVSRSENTHPMHGRNTMPS